MKDGCNSLLGRCGLILGGWEAESAGEGGRRGMDGKKKREAAKMFRFEWQNMDNLYGPKNFFYSFEYEETELSVFTNKKKSNCEETEYRKEVK